jgi:hypothetical protein
MLVGTNTPITVRLIDPIRSDEAALGAVYRASIDPPVYAVNPLRFGRAMVQGTGMRFGSRCSTTRTGSSMPVNPPNSSYHALTEQQYASSNEIPPQRASSESTGPFQYSKAAPITEVRPEELPAVAQAFSGGIGQYATDHQGQPVSAPASQDASLAERWTERSQDAQEIGKSIRMQGARNTAAMPGIESSGTKTYSYNIGDDLSAALMTLKHGQSETELEYLATHPGTSGAGKTMIEKAVNESQAAGNRGDLKLSSDSDASDGFYQSMGFQFGNDGYMRLKPGENELWSQENGKWGLKQHQDDGYLIKTNTKDPQ